MKFRNILSIATIVVAALSFNSCQKEETPTAENPLQGLVKLKEGYAPGAKAKVEIWGVKNFYAGYNRLTVVLYDSLDLTKKIEDAHIHFSPIMTMPMNGMTMQHSTPVENPSETAVSGTFPGAIAFVMASMGGSWQLNVAVHNHKYDAEGTASFDIMVDNPTVSTLTVFSSTETPSNKLVLSMIEPQSPKVGVNDIEFTLHKKVSNFEWPADDTYTIEITPSMPSMGHGSPNNVDPVSSGNGHYKGKVNFTMSGEWQIDVVVKKNGVAVSQNLNFKITI